MIFHYGFMLGFLIHIFNIGVEDLVKFKGLVEAFFCIIVGISRPIIHDHFLLSSREVLRNKKQSNIIEDILISEKIDSIYCPNFYYIIIIENGTVEITIMIFNSVKFIISNIIIFFLYIPPRERSNHFRHNDQ